MAQPQWAFCNCSESKSPPLIVETLQQDIFSIAGIIGQIEAPTNGRFRSMIGRIRNTAEVLQV
jgi:hypothetical protein